jgi:hypothetical protein
MDVGELEVGLDTFDELMCCIERYGTRVAPLVRERLAAAAT